MKIYIVQKWKEVTTIGFTNGGKWMHDLYAVFDGEIRNQKIKNNKTYEFI